MPVHVQHIPDEGRGSPVVGAFGIERDDGLESAVYLSVGLDARAKPGDEVDDPNDLRGWWGATYGLPVGSRLWLLRRKKRTQATLDLAADYTKEALKWMVEDGIVSAVNASAEFDDSRPTQINVTTELVRLDGSRWERYWQNVA